MRRSWSVWDELDLNYAPAPGHRRRRDLREHACDRRTEFLTAPPAASTEDEVARRTSAWMGCIEGNIEVRDWTAWLRPRPTPAGGILMLALFLGPVLFGLLLLGFGNHPWIVGGLIVSFAIALGMAWHGEQQYRRLYRVLRLRSCGRCGYDLSAMPAHELDACPECGEPWPLVPPPAELTPS